jgi:hypothetical protein
MTSIQEMYEMSLAIMEASHSSEVDPQIILGPNIVDPTQGTNWGGQFVSFFPVGFSPLDSE